MPLAGTTLPPNKQALPSVTTVLNSAFDGVALIDLNLRLVYANPALCEIMECSCTEQIAGREVAEFLSAETLCLLREHVHAVLAGEPVRFEGTGRTSSGRLLPIEVGVSLLRDADGQPHLLFAVVRDMTERKGAEDALRESERWLRTITEISKDAMVAIGADGLITLFNPAAERMFGWTAEEMLGQPLDRLMPQEHREAHREYVRSYFATGSPSGAINKTVELPAERKGGEQFTVELSLSSSKRHGRPVVLAVIRDITERKREQVQDLAGEPSPENIPEGSGFSLPVLQPPLRQRPRD